MLASVKDGTSSALQFPIFGLFIYAWLVMLCNRTDTMVDGEGATIRNGPIWCGALPLLRVERRSVKCPPVPVWTRRKIRHTLLFNRRSTRWPVARPLRPIRKTRTGAEGFARDRQDLGAAGQSGGYDCDIHVRQFQPAPRSPDHPRLGWRVYRRVVVGSLRRDIPSLAEVYANLINRKRRLCS